ncbi:SGNH/GDSL hydrolase family protein [Pseudarthrobacter sp. NamB4]|uniref:SGNH/GDSL hydrolase family protein n=1 Tax=Pseudarthrobacter sp. NamB4 TaxID=2576837 RepID=UPI0014853CB3|nr:SGNH/GDSL hydrolase family protein [Pseudarthrobacter sp. NamB4]
MEELSTAVAGNGHVVLLGDSIFDNGAYVGGSPDVVAQLRDELPDWRCTLLAVDGDVTPGVLRQLASLPRDATHVVVSVGGNDALGYAPLLEQRTSSVGEALAVLGAAAERFAGDYQAMLDAVKATGLPSAVCTIYDTPPSQPGQKIIKAALCLFNDAITRAAFSRGAGLIDLRLICSEDGDYANPIEPSAQGGQKIARAIAGFTGAAQTAAVDLPEPTSIVISG